MLLATAGAAIWALSGVLTSLSFATLSGPGSIGTAHNLFTAGLWLAFAAGLIVLGGISYSIYTTLMKHLWSAVWELVGATAAALFFVIGLLVVAAASDGNSDAGLIVSAIGLGGWAILLLANAARCALAEQAASDGQRRAGLWFAAAGALVLMAVAYGFPNTSAEDVTAQIVDAAIWFVGTAALLSVLSVARQRHLILTKHFPILAAGLCLLSLSWLAEAIAAGVVLPPHSITSIRIGLSIPPFIDSVAFAVLAWAALYRIGELEAPSSKRVAVEAPYFSPFDSTEGPAFTAPSWKPDPVNVHELRWWDGTRWTEHVLDSGRPSVDALRQS